MTPNTDIVIGVRHCADNLRECVQALEEHTRNFRLILVQDSDNEADAIAIDEIGRRRPNTLSIRTFRQRWFTRAFNAGLRLVRTPYAVLLNADTIPRVDWLEELIQVRDEVAQAAVMATGVIRDTVGLVGSVLSYEEPRRYHVCRTIPEYVTGHCWLVNMQAMFEVSNSRDMPGWYLDETRADCIHIRSDNEMCHRLYSLGYVAVMSFKSVVDHHGGKSWGHQLHTIPHTLNAVDEYWF